MRREYLTFHNLFEKIKQGIIKHKYIAFIILLFILVFSLRVSESGLVSCNSDLSSIAYNGMALSEGKIPYRDTIEGKPPLSYFILWPLFKAFGVSFIAIGLFSIVWMFLASFFIFLIVKNILGFKPACLAAVVYTIFSASKTIEGTCPNYTTWMILPLIISVYFIVLAEGNKRSHYYFFAGFFSMLGVLAKLPAIFNFIGICVFLIISFLINNKEGQSLSFFLTKISYSLAGFFAGVIPFLLFFYSFGGTDQFLNPSILPHEAQYIAMSNTYSYLPSDISLMIYNLLLRTTVPVAIKALENIFIWFFSAVFVLIFLFKLNFKKSDYRNKIFLLLVIWSFFSLIGVYIGGRFYPHYFVQIVPGFSMLSTFGIIYLYKNIKKLRLLLILVTVFMITQPIHIDFKKNPLDTFAETKVDDEAFKTGMYIKKNSLPKDYIYVWGYVPEIYVYSERFAPTRHYKFWGIVESMNGTRAVLQKDVPDDIFLDDLKKNMPLFFVLSNEYGIEKYVDPEIGEYPELNKFLDDNYAFDKEIGSIRIFKRK